MPLGTVLFVIHLGLDMKKIEAIIKPFKLDEVKEALHEVGIDIPRPARGACRRI